MKQSTIIERFQVCKLITDQLMRYKPTNEDTSQEANNRQEQLSSDKVKQIEQCHAKQLVRIERA